METDQAAPAPEETDFEASIARLETVARRLEDPDTPLDEALTLYEEGVRLARLCAQRLEQAELKIEELRADASETDDTDHAG